MNIALIAHDSKKQEMIEFVKNMNLFLNSIRYLRQEQQDLKLWKIQI